MKIKVLISIVLAILAFSSCKINEVTVGDVKGIKINSIDKTKANIEFLMPIDNPNNFKFKITKANLDIAINKNNLGRIKKIKKIVVPAKSNEVHSFFVEVEYKDLLSGTVSLIGGLLKNKTQIKLDGYIKVKAFCVISKKIEIHENNPVKLFK